LETVQKNFTRAERDNDFIYHQDIPASSALPPISEAELGKPIVPSGLLDPNSVIGKDGAIFGELLGWGAQEAISKS
jgi:programmed cell death 6-interacting protein